ncbi:Aste57867_19283 [Aphanomyces stellatus]|uniref:Aste57867_19283 protein n=1 Tax=Aphanomyces stellatus TaxID=120398 RepID=A0A485LCD2_9STRA|nr:hypothetical protein As57867_019219 [Aphanomyces stellatus]VFT96003.1 Aste57867_19283 [Aphanomyces stellatus]
MGYILLLVEKLDLGWVKLHLLQRDFQAIVVGHRMFVSPDPTASSLLYVGAVVDVGEMGMIVSSLSLVTARSVPAELRGSVSGVYSFVGAIGILVTAKHVSTSSSISVLPITRCRYRNNLVLLPQRA